jgi:hypothetical protein
VNTRPRRGSRSALGIAVAAALAAAGTASAADWEFNPTVEAGYLYDDNYRLTPPGTEISVQGPVADVSLEMRMLNPASEFSLTPRIRTTYFPNEQALDTTDYFADLNWVKHGQKVETEVQGEFADQDVINSEQPAAEIPGNPDLGQTQFGDAGRVLVKNRRTREALYPTMTYDLSQLRSLEFGVSLADVNFDHEIPGAQVDFRNADLTAGLKTRFSSTSSFTARVRGARFDINNDGDSKSFGAELQWDTQSVGGTRAFLRGGAQQVEFTAGRTESVWVGGGGVNSALGRNQFFFDLSRGVGPSSAGAVITRDQLRARWTRDMTPRLQLLAGLRGTRDEAVDPSASFTERSYATGDIGVQWHWQEEFSLRVAYNYTWQEYKNSLTDAATSTGATATVLYQPSHRRR